MTEAEGTLGERLRTNLGAVWARASVRFRAAYREKSWFIGDTLFPFLAMSAFILVYRGLGAPRVYEGFVVLGGAMIAYWNNVLWSMASQFFWEKEQGQLSLYLIAPVSRMSILLGMALGGMTMTTARAITILAGGILVFDVSLPLDRVGPALGLFVLSLAAVYGMGMILSSLFLLWGREAWHTATLFQEPIHLLSGFYFPVRALGVGVAALGSLLPITLGLDGIRQIFYGSEARGLLPVPWIVAIEIGLLILYLVLAQRSLALLETLGKQEGRLTIRGG